jgi:hypothetical protein
VSQGLVKRQAEGAVMMQAVDSKWQILHGAGYAYNFDLMLYFNRKRKKVFSVEFVEDHSENELESCINEESNGAGWRFYFNSPHSPAVQRELENVLG